METLNSLNYPSAKKFWIYDNGGNPLNTHDILPDDWTVADSVARFFAAVMDTSTLCGNVILPIAGTFNVSLAGYSAVKIKWSEDPQANIIHFIPERSFDGINFNPLVKINHTGLSNYQHLDAGFQKGKNYYRLKTLYQDGSSKYSEIRSVTILQNAVQVYPNPVKGNLQITLNKNFSGKTVLLELYNAMGQKIKSIVFPVNQSQTKSMVINPFPSGNYLLKVICNSTLIETHKIIISN